MGAVLMSDIYNDMDSALQEVLTKHEDPLRVNRWVVIVETINENGEREMWQMSSRDSRAWDTKGMLAHAMDYELAKGIQALTAQGE